MVSKLKWRTPLIIDAMRTPTSFVAKKVASAKTFPAPERLPPTTFATNFHGRLMYRQVMVWLDRDGGRVGVDYNRNRL